MRLSILDPDPRSNQPMHSRSGKSVIVYNGEVYNHRQLARKWQLSLQTTSDTEVVLEGFEKYGVDILPQLEGMFAFAIYNKNNGEICVARDSVGIKPLYYFYLDNQLGFASELERDYSCFSSAVGHIEAGGRPLSDQRIYTGTVEYL